MSAVPLRLQMKLFNEMRSNSIGSVLGCFLCACHLTCVQSETCETSSLLQFHPVDANGKYDTHGSSTFAQSIVGGPSISNVTGPAKIFRTGVLSWSRCFSDYAFMGDAQSKN